LWKIPNIIGKSIIPKAQKDSMWLKSVPVAGVILRLNFFSKKTVLLTMEQVAG